MVNKKKKSLVYPAVFMLVLAAVLTFLLAMLNEQTKPIVAKNAEFELRKKILYVFSIENDGTQKDVDNKFTTNVKETDKKYNNKPIFEYEKDGKKAYAVSLQGPGLWGPIEAYVALSEDYNTILGIDFIKQSETPGLGGRIEEPFYKEQYRNIRSKDVFKKVDFISGATMTSLSVARLVSGDLAKFVKTMGGSN